MALRFNGTSSFARTPTLDLTAYNTLTISFWAYFTSTTSNQITIESSASSSVNANSLYFNHAQAGGITQVRIRGTSLTAMNFTYPSLNNWHHYVVTINLPIGVQPFTVYVDGASVTLTEATTPAQNATSFGNYQWNFMSRNGASNFTNGSIAELALFPGAILSQDEVLALYYGVNPLELRADVKPHYWKMEGDIQLYGQDSSAQSLDFSATNVVIDSHPPIGFEYDFWHSSSVENLPIEQGGGNLLDILAELAFRGSSQFLSSVDRLGLSANHGRVAIFSDIQKASALYSEKHGRGALSSDIQKIISLYVEQHGRGSFQSDLLKYIGLASNFATNLNVESSSYKESLLNMIAALNLSVDSSIRKQSNLDSYFNGNLDAYFSNTKSSDLQLTEYGRLSLSALIGNSASAQSYFNQRGALESSISNNKNLLVAIPLNGDLSSNILASYSAGFTGEGRLSLFGEAATDGSISLSSVLITNSDLNALLGKSSELSREFLGRGTVAPSIIKGSNLSLDILGNLDFYPSINSTRAMNLGLAANLDVPPILGGLLGELNASFYLGSQLYGLGNKIGELSLEQTSVADLIANLSRSSTISSDDGGSELYFYAILPASSDSLLIDYNIGLFISRVALSDLNVNRLDGLNLQMHQTPQCILYIDNLINLQNYISRNTGLDL